MKHVFQANPPFALSQLLRKGLVWFGSNHWPSLANEGQSPVVDFGVPSIDSLLPSRGLEFGALHEWSFETSSANKTLEWHPPLSIISVLLKRAIKLSASQESLKQKKLILWVGRKCWPTPHLLSSIFSLPENEQGFKESTSSLPTKPFNLPSENSIFLDPPDKQSRLWALIQGLRCSLTLSIIADGSGFSSVASRRIQLAAQKQNALILLCRPPWELGRPSSAQTKWLVSPLPSSEASPAWSLELIRSRGLSSPAKWVLQVTEERSYEEISFDPASAQGSPD